MIKCAIVGLGRIGWALGKDPKREKPASHVYCITETEETKLVAGCDIDANKREEFKKEFSVPVYEYVSEMLEKEVIDILHIATPTETHKKIIEKALKYKVPVIICEKPLTKNLREAKKILKKIKKSDTKLLINYERRYSTDYIYTKDIIKNKKYGEILSVGARLYIKTRSLKKILWHDSTHLIDIIMFLLDEDIKPKKIFKKEKTASIFFESPYPVYMEIGYADYLLFEIEIFFEKGKIVIGNGIFGEYESRESPFYSGFNSLIKKDTGFEKTGYFINMFKDAIRAFKDKDYTPNSNIYSAYKNIEIMSKIIKYL